MSASNSGAKQAKRIAETKDTQKLRQTDQDEASNDNNTALARNGEASHHQVSDILTSKQVSNSLHPDQPSSGDNCADRTLPRESRAEDADSNGVRDKLNDGDSSDSEILDVVGLSEDNERRDGGIPLQVERDPDSANLVPQEERQRMAEPPAPDALSQLTFFQQPDELDNIPSVVSGK
jgi:hypothetical protein